MTDMCHKECIQSRSYSDKDLKESKFARSVCIDECVAKYLDVENRVSKKWKSIHAYANIK